MSDDDERARMEQLAGVAGVLADPTRLRILLALIEREATVSELVAILHVPQPRVSTHLAALAHADLVSFRPAGRQRRYAAEAARVEPILTGLQFAADIEAPDQDERARREIARDTPLRRARRCYDHIAGAAAVELLDTLLERDWLAVDSPVEGRVQYTLTAAGETGLDWRRVDLARARRARRIFAFACPDWTEVRPHLGGALARVIADTLERDGVIARTPDRREIPIERSLAHWLDRT